MGDGLWAMGYGLWVMGDGLWAMGYGRWAAPNRGFPFRHYHNGPFEMFWIPAFAGVMGRGNDDYDNDNDNDNDYNNDSP
ncbi:hypothetical protein [Desulfatirhabdium butyrativorans]|uniref:hypothetical protein n=1 Tax=Desulfatirhabdium butyrativorans TaxID=340467 RepID=UPI0006882814|nr:hypothetical protein [Desulfatirhabdium butyrativorans]